MGEGDAALMQCVWTPGAVRVMCGLRGRRCVCVVAGGREAARRVIPPRRSSCAVREGKCAATLCEAVGSRA